MIDDDHYMLQAASYMLNKIGVQCEYANSGKIALELLKQRDDMIAENPQIKRCKLILMDY